LQLQSVLSVDGYHDHGQDIGNTARSREPIKLQDSQDTTHSRSNK